MWHTCCYFSGVLTAKQNRFQSNLQKVVAKIFMMAVVGFEILLADDLQAQSVTLAMADNLHSQKSSAKKALTSERKTAPVAVAETKKSPATKNKAQSNETYAASELTLEKVALKRNPFLLVRKNLDVRPNLWLTVNAAFGQPARNALALREKILDQHQPAVAYIKASLTF